MRIVVVDDETPFAQDLAEALKQLGHAPEEYATLAEARRNLAEVEEPLVVLLDHDFGKGGEEDEEGYGLCKWLRENHPFGLLLPIIYLTGREPPDRFLAYERDDPFTHPSAHINKMDFNRDPELLYRLVQRCQEQFDRVCALGEKQSARQALMNWAKLGPEPDDER